MKRIAAIAVLCLSLLVLPSLALANSSSTSQGYGAQTVQTLNAKASQDSAGAAGTLPFTGINVGVLMAGGVVLLGAGLAVRRLSAES